MLAFDASTGAAGDMIQAALIDAGADRELLQQVEGVVPVSYEFRRVDRAGVKALKVDVVGGGDDEGGHAHRSYREVVDIVEGTDIASPVKEDALEVFRLIGEAEAAVHDVPLDELDFHEVGADDAVADVLGASLLFHDLDEDAVTGTIAVGGGRVEAAHGSMPVPVPAVTEILEGSGHAVEGGPVEAELLTPTGAALLVHFTEPVDGLPGMRVEWTGYGAGKKEFSVPNVLRVLRGEQRMRREDIEVLETNVDDVSPEVLGGLYDRLLEEGARDVSLQPLQMKKNRPGHLVRVVVRREDAARLARVLAEETGSLGVRSTPYTHRFVADRETHTVEVDVESETYQAEVKVASINGEVYDVSGEYEDARRIAGEAGVPVRRVLHLMEESWRE